MNKADTIKKELDKIMTKEPSEIKTLLQQKGTYNNTLIPTIYAEGETRTLEDILYRLRTTTREDRDLSTLKTITINILTPFSYRFEKWYGLKNSAQLINLAISSIKEAQNTTNLLEILDALMLYINKTNFWIDTKIPWHELNKVFHKLRDEK